MATRVHRIGTIYSRIDGLIRKGYLKESDKPIWFDVYQNFPPKYAPTYKRKVPDTQLRVILYEEDTLRAKIHKTFGRQVGLMNLSDNKQLFCESLLKTCQQYIAEGLSESEAIEQLKYIVKGSPNKVDEELEKDDISDVKKTLQEVL